MTSTVRSPTPAASAERPRRPQRPRRHWALALVAACTTLWTLGLVSCAIPRDDTAGTALRPLSAPARGLDAQLLAVEAAWPAAVAPNATAHALGRYNRSVAKVLKTIQDERLGVPWNKPFVTSSFELTFTPGAKNSPHREIYNLTEAIPASSVKIKHAHRRVAGDGLGVACVTVRGRDANPEKSSPFVPLNGRFLPATFVIDCTAPGQPVATFFNTRHAQTTVIGGNRKALAYDFTAGLELSLESRFLRKFALAGLFKPAAQLENSGLYITETFNPKRIPVIMVHGLASDPHIWLNPMNEILADPVLRERYQLWYFLYPTGLPVAVNAHRLRHAIEQAIETFDPERDDFALQDMVIVGHSMGGLLSRMQVIDSGTELWASHFAVPPEKLWVAPQRRKLMTDALFFDHSPYIDRAVFVATPHRGSHIADFRVVRRCVNLIRLPLDLAGLVTEFAQLDLSFFNPELQKFDAFGTRSIDNLSPRHPLLHALDKRPILVPHHSIIGDRGRPLPLDRCSDGVVPYSSAHLDTAISEKLIPGPHSCVHHPAVAAEIVRILHVHLNKSSPPRVPSRR